MKINDEDAYLNYLSHSSKKKKKIFIIKMRLHRENSPHLLHRGIFLHDNAENIKKNFVSNNYPQKKKVYLLVDYA